MFKNYIGHDHGSAPTKPLDPEIEEHLREMALPVQHQALRDRLSALVILGKVDGTAARVAVAQGDWNLVRRMVRSVRQTRELPK